MSYRLTEDGTGLQLETRSKGSFKESETLQFAFSKTLDQQASQEQVFNHFKANYLKE